MKLRTGKSLGGQGKAPRGTILRATSAKSDLVKFILLASYTFR